MADLHPQVVAGGGTCLRPLGQRRPAVAVLDHDIPRPLQPAPVHHHVAGDRQSHAAAGPAPVQSRMALVRLVVGRRQALGHGGLGNAIGQGRAAGQAQGIGEFGHGYGLVASGLQHTAPAARVAALR